MDVDAPVPWYQRPGPTILAGIVLLAVCGVIAAAWLGGGPDALRPFGGITGAAGIYLTVTGVISFRERSTS